MLKLYRYALSSFSLSCIYLKLLEKNLETAFLTTSSVVIIPTPHFSSKILVSTAY